jgi:hypothetical protein
VAGKPALAERHAGEVVSIARSLHVFVEGEVQRAADHVGGRLGLDARDEGNDGCWDYQTRYGPACSISTVC